MNLFRKLMATYDYVSGRFECSEAKGAIYKKCLDIRKVVFGDELKRARDSRACPAFEDEYDPVSIHLACKDTKSGEIIGCVRMTRASEMLHSPELVAEYHLALFPVSLLPNIIIATRLAVLKEFRKTPAALLLAEKCYEQGLSKLASPISVLVCEPNLYPMYRRLGYKPLGRVYNSAFGGYRLPLYIIVHDYEHLEKQKSPFFKIAKKLKCPVLQDGLNWQKEMSEKNEMFDPGFIFLDGEGAKCENLLTARLSAEGKKIIYERAVAIKCREGEKIIAADGGERTIGIVKKGLVEIRKKNKKVALLAEGDIFGEIAFILSIPRTADVIAVMPDTEVIFLSLSIINRLTNMKDQVQIWKNLAQLTAYRLSQL